MNEFSLIEQLFKPLDISREDVLLGIGDDAACLHLPAGTNLLISTDTLVEDVHFLLQWGAYDIACRSVMVNVSDLAAMGAHPCWATLALTVPEMDVGWLKEFTRGLKDSLSSFNMSLVGGDTTRGPLSITLSVLGHAPVKQEIRRSGAKVGDIILVSGELGAAALAVSLLDKEHLPPKDKNVLMSKLIHPKPRVDLIPFLRAYATSALDISDGLSADLNHLCTASQVGACLNQESIPIHSLLYQYAPDTAVDFALSGGDDYELCFTVPPERLERLTNELKKAQLTCYPIGVIEKELGLRINIGTDCKTLIPKGYSHF